MASSSPSNPKTIRHTRSKSHPVETHPFISQFNESLSSLSSSSSLSLSLSTIRFKLNGLMDLYSCVDGVLQLPLMQQALSGKNNEKLVEAALDGSLRLLDTCTIASDVLVQTEQALQQLRLKLRRRSKRDVAKAIDAYLTTRRTLKKVVAKSLKDIKNTENKFRFSSLDTDEEVARSTVQMLGQCESTAMIVLGSLLSYIGGITAPGANKKLGFFSRMMGSGKQMESVGETNKFEAIDSNLGKSMENVEFEVEEVEHIVQELQGGVEGLSRHLVKTRVTLLNILNH